MTDIRTDKCPCCERPLRNGPTIVMKCWGCGYTQTADYETPSVPEELDATLGAELRDTFERLMPKMVKGKLDYGDKSLGLPLSELLDEVDEEIIDILGWVVILRRRLNELRARMKAGGLQ